PAIFVLEKSAKSSGPRVLQLIYTTEVKPGPIGIFRQAANLAVLTGDILGIHYAQNGDTKVAIIPNSRGNDGVVRKTELFTTINAPIYHENLVLGTNHDFSKYGTTRSTFALRAWSTGVPSTGLPVSTTPILPDVTKECKVTVNGKDYKGKVSQTATGKQCQSWMSQTPHTHYRYTGDQFPDQSVEDAMNYCRNPENKQSGPWCFTTDTKTKWEYCAIPMCECKLTNLGTEYKGSVASTKQGFTCQRWDTQTPHTHPNTDASRFPDNTLNEASNFCRNPELRSEGPFCYTTAPEPVWDYCEVPFCECKKSPQGAEFQGRTSETVTGKKCQRWDSQTPHKHTRRNPADFPDNTLAEASNYCRNPDGDKAPWCYTMDEQQRWEYCAIPYCEMYNVTTPAPTRPPTTPLPDTCPQYVGRPPTDLPRRGGIWAHLMVENRFPCGGVVTGFEYFRINTDSIAFIGIWRPTPGSENHTLIAKTAMQPGPLGPSVQTLTTPVRVEKGDYIGVHYDAATKSVAIPNSRGGDDVVGPTELFRTINGALYDAQAKVGTTFNLARFQVIKSTYAIRAMFQGESFTETETPNDNKVYWITDWLDLRERNYILFELKTCKAGSIYLAPKETTNYTQVYQVEIGGAGNTQSFIAKGQNTYPRKVVVKTPYIVDCNQYRQFWVSWVPTTQGLMISAGEGLCQGVNTFMTWTDPDTFQEGVYVNSVGFGSYLGARGYWKFYRNLVNPDCHVKSGPFYLQSQNFPEYYFGYNERKEAYLLKGEQHPWFTLEPGLSAAGNNTVSFQSSEFPGFYLRHYGYLLFLEHNDDPRNEKIFYEDATFIMRKDNWYPGYVDFESVNYPNHFIRHQNYRLKISKYQDSGLFRMDASFRIVQECKDSMQGRDYTGKVAQTKYGLLCQRWDAQTPHSHGKTDPNNFPDLTLSDANNYCRNPDGEPGGPWCYTTDPEVRWQYCDIPYCPNVTPPPPSPTTPLYPGVCPSKVGRPATELPRRGGNWAHLMVDNQFPCDGYVTAWEYQRSTPDTKV
ncbi:unnamed protein product, partial [Owenia fusiformis]